MLRRIPAEHWLDIFSRSPWRVLDPTMRKQMLTINTELSLTVPITNSLAFLFTVLGDWYVEGKVISRDTWIGMALSLGGIALCVQSKL